MRPVWHGETHEASPTCPGQTTVSPRGTRLISQGHPEEEDEDEDEDEDISESRGDRSPHSSQKRVSLSRISFLSFWKLLESSM